MHAFVPVQNWLPIGLPKKRGQYGSEGDEDAEGVVEGGVDEEGLPDGDSVGTLDSEGDIDGTSLGEADGTDEGCEDGSELG